MLAAAEVTTLWEAKMSNQSKRDGAGSARPIPNIPFAPALAPMLWNPFLAADAEALREFSTIAREWQDFVSRRLREDVTLAERLARCSSRLLK